MTKKNLVFGLWLWAVSASYYFGFNPFDLLSALLLLACVAVYAMSISFTSAD